MEALPMKKMNEPCCFEGKCAARQHGFYFKASTVFTHISFVYKNVGKHTLFVHKMCGICPKICNFGHIFVTIRFIACMRSGKRAGIFQ